MVRLANCLVTLRDQINARWPNRSKSSDGWIGNEAHQATKSDHNPNGADVVQALDITHDPANGPDTYALAETLRLNRDPRIKYVISNGRIFSSIMEPWTWRPYNGVNAHSQHVHVSADDNPVEYDDASQWNLNRIEVAPGRGFQGITATVFGGPSDAMSGAATAYANLIAPGWWDRPGVALPARINDRPLPMVKVTHNGKSVICPVIDVGPWNTRDPYWISGARPQAETGVDMTGRKTNSAGIDLTPAAANAIGLAGKGLVDWEFVQQKGATMPDSQSATTGQTLPPGTTTPYNAGVEDCIIELAKAQRPIIERYLKAPSAMTAEEQRRMVIVALGGTPPPSSPVLLLPGQTAPAPAATATPAADPAKASPTSVNISTALAGVIASLGLSATGVIGAPVGPDATTTGMLLPLLSMGAGALGIPAPVVSMISTLFGRLFTPTPPKA